MTEKLPETKNSLEILKEKLNPLLKEYLAERLGNKKENEKKEAFLRKFNILDIEEKKEYRNYVYNIVKESPEFIKDIKDNDDFIQILKLLSTIDKLEVYAGIYNNCKDDELIFKNPTFFVNSGKITNSKNGKSIDFGSLGNEYNGKGTYKLYLDNLGLPSGDYLLIGNNEKGGIIVYNKDGNKEFESKQKQGKIKFESKTTGVKVEFNIKTI